MELLFSDCKKYIHRYTILRGVGKKEVELVYGVAVFRLQEVHIQIYHTARSGKERSRVSIWSCCFQTARSTYTQTYHHTARSGKERSRVSIWSCCFQTARSTYTQTYHHTARSGKEVELVYWMISGSSFLMRLTFANFTRLRSRPGTSDLRQPGGWEMLVKTHNHLYTTDRPGKKQTDRYVMDARCVRQVCDGCQVCKTGMRWVPGV